MRGRSVSCYIEHAGVFNERMGCTSIPAATVTIVAGTHSHGQGHATAFAQLVSDWLGVPFERIRYVQGDTEKVPFGRGTYAARSAVLGGCALRLAADAIIEKAKPMAAHPAWKRRRPTSSSRPASSACVGTDRGIAHGRHRQGVLRAVPAAGSPARPARPAASVDGMIPSYPNGCHVCEVELDPATGEITIDRYTVVDDCGRPINPMICEGQIQGGIAQGIGQALMENVVYDRDERPAALRQLHGLRDAACRRHGRAPTQFHNVPCTTNPLGIKGVGESGTIGAPPAVMNAVVDALRSVGVDAHRHAGDAGAGVAGIRGEGLNKSSSSKFSELVIARRAAPKQSRAQCCGPWIASLRSQ